MGQNLGGRAYLVNKLGNRSLSRRRAVEVLNLVFREMGLALQRGEYVEFPFGYLKAEKRLSERWRAIGDEPMRPYFIEYYLDERGERFLEGGKLCAWPPGWSLKADRSSPGYVRTRGKAGKGSSAGARPAIQKVANRAGRSGK